jgi:hypothetical protein
MMRKMAAELLLAGEIGGMPQRSVHGFAARHGPSQPAWFARSAPTAGGRIRRA